MRTYFILLFILSGCGMAVCGDGLLEAGEACDDGNTIDADGCEANCTLPACENGIVDPGEICFDAAVEFPFSQGGTDLVTGDFDKDGDLDIAVTRLDGISILENQEGTFLEGQRQELDFAGALIAEDFDQNGTIDIATALQDNNQLAVFSGVGDNTFSEPLLSSTQLGPFDLAAGDFNQDGALDIALTHEQSDSVGIFELNLAGQFSLEKEFPLPGGGLPIVAGDFDGDEATDFIAGVSILDQLSIFLNNGAGDFLEVAPILSENPFEIAVLDFNQDEILDLAVVNNAQDALSLFTGNGDGTFEPTQSFLVDSSQDVFAGDFDHDGDLDLAVASAVSIVAKLALFLNEEGRFVAGDILDLSDLQEVSAVTAGDFNGDGALDIAATLTPDGGLSILFSNP